MNTRDALCGLLHLLEERILAEQAVIPHKIREDTTDAEIGNWAINGAEANSMVDIRRFVGAAAQVRRILAQRIERPEGNDLCTLVDRILEETDR